MKATFHPEAREELLASVVYYNAEEPGLGAEFLQSVAECIGRIRDFPESYPRILANYRRAGVRKFPYGIVYLAGDDGLVLVAVMHNRRSPDYFLDRLK